MRKKETLFFHLQGYAIERHFQGVEYNSLTSALFVFTSCLNQWEKGFYCVTIYTLERVLAQKQLSKCEIQRLCIFNCLCWIYLHWIKELTDTTKRRKTAERDHSIRTQGWQKQRNRQNSRQLPGRGNGQGR